MTVFGHVNLASRQCIIGLHATRRGCLDRDDIVALVFLAGHQETEFSHAFRATAGDRFPLRDLASSCPVAVLLMELLLASLALALQALDNVDGPTNVDVAVVHDLLSGLLALQAHSTSTWKGLSLGETGAAGEVELDLTTTRGSKGCK